ncbi:MAG: hypothetical protein H5T71_00810 [Chloroflexi bacterium]|nr:hypothetical protein [Synergistales bacterium]MBC7238625.1 hypothetical protein [Chloroflexota bacterium]
MARSRKDATYYFGGRATDILSTWLNVRWGGYRAEASPVGRWSMEALGFGGYVLLNLALSLLLYLALRRLQRPWLTRIVVASFYGISLLNVLTYALALNVR